MWRDKGSPRLPPVVLARPGGRVIGLKAAKVLGIGAFLLAFKNFVFLLLVPFIWIGNKIRALFRKPEAGDT